MKSLVVQTIAHCNELFAATNLHPLVSLIRWPKAKSFPVSLCFGFYTVWLRGTQGCCPAAFGQGTCDFCEGTLLPVQPGNRVEGSWWTDTGGAKEGWLLCFHPSLFEENRMAGRLEAYTFFRYAGNEALHLSLRERKIVEREVQCLEEELGRGVDEYSCAILADRILLLLDYVARFYRRQFILRHEANRRRVVEADRWLEAFFQSGQAHHEAEWALELFPRQFDCSPAYFNDLLKVETGKTAGEYFRCKQIGYAEKLLKQGGKSVEEVAAELGFPTDRAFCALFEQLKGRAPESFRNHRYRKPLS